MMVYLEKFHEFEKFTNLWKILTFYKQVPKFRKGAWNLKKNHELDQVLNLWRFMEIENSSRIFKKLMQLEKWKRNNNKRKKNDEKRGKTTRKEKK